MSEKKKDELLFEAQLQITKTGGGGGQKDSRRDQNISRKIQHLESEISLWKNNIEFFARSKTADKLRAEFNAKIDAAKQELESLRNRVRKLNQAKKAKAETNKNGD